MKGITALIIVILIIFNWKLFWPAGGITVSPVENDNRQIPAFSAKSTGQHIQQPETLVDDQRTELMIAEYTILEKARKNLKSRLARLKHEMWGLKFAVEDARQMNNIILNAHKLMKNPDMLGAFSSVEGIRDEISKVRFAEKSLREIDRLIEESKKKS